MQFLIRGQRRSGVPPETELDETRPQPRNLPKFTYLGVGVIGALELAARGNSVSPKASPIAPASRVPFAGRPDGDTRA